MLLLFSRTNIAECIFLSFFIFSPQLATPFLNCSSVLLLTPARPSLLTRSRASRTSHLFDNALHSCDPPLGTVGRHLHRYGLGREGCFWKVGEGRYYAVVSCVRCYCQNSAQEHNERFASNVHRNTIKPNPTVR